MVWGLVVSSRGCLMENRELVLGAFRHAKGALERMGSRSELVEEGVLGRPELFAECSVLILGYLLGQGFARQGVDDEVILGGLLPNSVMPGRSTMPVGEWCQPDDVGYAGLWWRYVDVDEG